MENFLGTVPFPGQHLHHGGNDIAGLLNHHPVTDPQIFAGDLLLVVKGRSGDGAAGDKDRLQFRHGSQHPAASDLHGDVAETGAGLLRLVLVGDGPARGLAGGAEPPVLFDPVGLDHGSVGLE